MTLPVKWLAQETIYRYGVGLPIQLAMQWTERGSAISAATLSLEKSEL